MGLNGCCGCFNLKDGSTAVGIVFLVFSCLKMLSVIIGYALLGVSESVIRDQANSSDSVQTESDLYTVKTIEYALIPAVFVVAFLILINGVLLYGVRRDNKVMILAWLITYGTLLTLDALWTVANLIMMAINLIVVGQALVLVIAFTSLGCVALFWYWWVVVLAHFQNLFFTPARAPDFDHSKDVMLT